MNADEEKRLTLIVETAVVSAIRSLYDSSPGNTIADINNKAITNTEKTYEKEMTEFSRICLEKPNQYSSRHRGTYGIHMSPATLFYYFKSL